MSFENSVTMYNLMRAFAGESQARNRYNMASLTARNEGHHAVAMILDATARQEQAHATVFYDFLLDVNFKNFDITASYPVNVVKTTMEHLKYGVHNELEEYENVYKNFADIAKSEGFDNIYAAFNMIATIENTHAQRFKNLLDDMEDNALYSKNNDTNWICTNCGHIHTGQSAPDVCPVCKMQRGYFLNKDYFTIL
jgi:rubrerythrin